MLRNTRLASLWIPSFICNSKSYQRVQNTPQLKPYPKPDIFILEIQPLSISSRHIYFPEGEVSLVVTSFSLGNGHQRWEWTCCLYVQSQSAMFPPQRGPWYKFSRWRVFGFLTSGLWHWVLALNMEAVDSSETSVSPQDNNQKAATKTWSILIVTRNAKLTQWEGIWKCVVMWSIQKRPVDRQH
jgi:hypothetical protein